MAAGRPANDGGSRLCQTSSALPHLRAILPRRQVVAAGLPAFGLAVLLAGCAAEGGKSSQNAAPAPAVACSKCEVTWVKVPTYGNKAAADAYTTQKSHVCPDCKGAVENFFANGKLEHTCKSCGDTMEACEVH